jgi:hypothetical protein
MGLLLIKPAELLLFLTGADRLSAKKPYPILSVARTVSACQPSFTYQHPLDPDGSLLLNAREYV